MSFSKIIGTGSYLPEKILTNHDLEKLLDTSDEWITTRTGIKQRHIIDKDQKTSDMAYEAATKAINAAKIDKNIIDLIINLYGNPPGSGLDSRIDNESSTNGNEV